MRKAAFAMAIAISAGTASAGGALLIRSTGAPFVWSTAAPIQFRTDNGPLSATVNQAQALARIQSMFNVWTAVPTANITYNHAGFINPTGAFTDGDVSTLAEYDAVEASCNAGAQNPVVYDSDGSILVALGMDETSVIGFAGPCAVNATQFVSGGVTMNGLFQDGNAAVPDLTATEYDAAFVHEIGHFSGLDHSQVNVNCLNGCGLNDLAGLPTMFPFLLHDSQVSLSVDDVAWISKFYPDASFATTHGTITGRVFFSDQVSQAQGVNVILRRVNAGGGENRMTAVSNVSGYRFRFFHGNPINSPQGDGLGTEDPSMIGFFEIPAPAGNYTIEVESINEEFVDGSSVGGPILLPMPGTAPAPSGPHAVTVGTTQADVDILLIGTPARFDQFEGP